MRPDTVTLQAILQRVCVSYVWLGGLANGGHDPTEGQAASLQRPAARGRGWGHAPAQSPCPDLPLASAKPATTGRVQVPTGPCTGCNRFLLSSDVRWASITEWRTAQGGFLTRSGSPAGR